MERTQRVPHRQDRTVVHGHPSPLAHAPALGEAVHGGRPRRRRRLRSVDHSPARPEVVQAHKAAEGLSAMEERDGMFECFI